MLCALSDVLDTSVARLLGEMPAAPTSDDCQALAAALGQMQLQLAQRQAQRRRLLRLAFATVCVAVVAIFVCLWVLQSPYLSWDYSDHEAAVLGVGFHSLEWLFVRIAPVLLIASVIGLVLTRKRD